MEKIIEVIMALVGLSVMEMEGGYLLCFCPEEEDTTAPDACYLKQVGEDVQVFKDSPHRKISLYESLINGDDLEPDNVFSLSELHMLQEDALMQKLMGE